MNKPNEKAYLSEAYSLSLSLYSSDAGTTVPQTGVHRGHGETEEGEENPNQSHTGKGKGKQSRLQTTWHKPNHPEAQEANDTAGLE